MKARRKTKEQKVKSIKYAIELHEKMKNSYFWNSPGAAGQRRYYEEQHSYTDMININGKKLEINCITSCSCKNIYYKGEFYFDGQKKNISVLKKILEEIKK
jgi:hypothetical protein